MALVQHRFMFLFLAAILAGFDTASASPFVSDRVSQASTGSTSTSLLQAKIDCPVSFESQNYTIITSRCKGPQYPTTECCAAFKDFSCLFAMYINDQSTNCADTLLTYINFHGSYPAGLFDECLKVTEWVSCKGVLADCPMDFEYQNYTIITSRCKAPQYPPTECCDAFKKFACPFAAYINNRSTNCADTMISGITFFGKYPEDIFTAQCRRGKNEEVSCDGVPGINTGVSSGGLRAQGSSGSLIAQLCGLGALSCIE